MLIALGISPGLRHLGYAVLQFDGQRAELLDADVLKGGRTVRALSTYELGTKFLVHYRILELVWQRHTPAVLGIGPRAALDEPEEYSEFVTTTIRALAGAMSLPTLQVPEDQLPKLLGSKSLNTAIKNHIWNPPQGRDQKQILAVSTALCAGLEFQRPPSERRL